MVLHNLICWTHCTVILRHCKAFPGVRRESATGATLNFWTIFVGRPNWEKMEPKLKEKNEKGWQLNSDGIDTSIAGLWCMKKLIKLEDILATNSLELPAEQQVSIKQFPSHESWANNKWTSNYTINNIDNIDLSEFLCKHVVMFCLTQGY